MKKREQANVCKKTSPAFLLSWKDSRGWGSLFFEKITVFDAKKVNFCVLN